MNRLFKTALCSSVALAALAASVPAVSQEITAGIRGTVYSPAGDTLSGITVTITDTRTGNVSTTTTNASGAFNVRSLQIGGPYTIRVSGGQYQDAVITDVITKLGTSSNFPIQLQEDQAGVEEIVITASAIVSSAVAVGPSSSFTLTDIETAPSISRQVRDIIRVDPRVNIGRSNNGGGFGISCNGGSPRVNSFTIDGVRAADAFGLNSSGNLARSTFPIPFDTIAAASVEFSPVDVEYGQFTGCNINVVTKSGSNEFHGSAFFLYNGDSITGSNIDGENADGNAQFDRYNWGAELGGPIIEDKLFFYGSYEETDEGDIPNYGGVSGQFIDGDTINDLNTASIDRVRGILEGQYGRTLGDVVSTLPNTSRRFFGRIDWNINDDHRLEATYGRLEENRLSGDDFGSGRGEFTFQDNFHNRGSKSDTYALRVFSDWSDNLSTEFRMSRNEINDIQDPVFGGEAQAENTPRIAIGGFGNEFFGQDFASGPGVFRSANQLDVRIDQIKFKADYVAGDHLITAGYELDNLDIFNLFIINATGTVFFEDIDALEAGQARLIRSASSFTGNPTDAAAEFTRNIHTFYLQDKWQVNSNFELVAGLRYDFYKSDDAPNLNPEFQDRFGFANTQAFGGLDVLQPRIGFTWTPEGFGNTTITGGFAKFSGGDPTVWFANSFQNFGGAIGIGEAELDDLGSCTAADLNVLSGGSFSGIPQCVLNDAQAQAQQNLGAVAAVDPDFKLPTQNRFSVGVTHVTENTGSDFFDDWTIQLDAIYSDIVNGVDFVDLSLVETGTAPDGRPIFSQLDLSGAGLPDGCNATFAGIREGFTNTSDACFVGRPSSDFQNILLTNAVNGGGHSFSISAQFGKTFDLTDRSTLDFRFGYAYNDSVVGNAGGSSTAGSNFEEVATSNFNNVGLGTSVNNNKHNFVIRATYANEFFEDLQTKVGAFFRVRSGRPLSYVFDANTSRGTFGDSDAEARSLLYIPTGADDPLVTFADTATQTAFLNFIEAEGLTEFGGSIIDRSAFSQPWAADLDLRISQELPGFFGSDKFELFANFENFLNFIGSGTGVQRFVRTGDVGEATPLVAAEINDQGQYVYSDFTAPGEFADVNDTLWRIQLGIKYKF
ncbi:TonB-dependent receptor [Kordiimonas laminariae]|uniref:TonB-dependent receptor n=1 Tax=Kordiimonas laminariae TaxID=2917717 RepID=UPI001FF52AA3|nr:carboxypeptidase regulatory-like domain-containing protein [Kordiimonas laminariae]MCK0068874.1 TonB-dependent receptor [Kordiimonas laminariae]